MDSTSFYGSDVSRCGYTGCWGTTIKLCSDHGFTLIPCWYHVLAGQTFLSSLGHQEVCITKDADRLS